MHPKAMDIGQPGDGHGSAAQCVSRLGSVVGETMCNIVDVLTTQFNIGQCRNARDIQRIITALTLSAPAIEAMLLFRLLLLCLIVSVRSQESYSEESTVPETYVEQSSSQKELQAQSGEVELDYDQSGWEDSSAGNSDSSQSSSARNSGASQSSSACCGRPQPCCPSDEILELGTCCTIPPPCCPPKPCCDFGGYSPFPVSPRWPQRSFYLLRRPLHPYSVAYPPPQRRPCCPMKRLPCCPTPPCCPIRPCCELDIPYCRRACPACPCRQALRRRAKRTVGCVTCNADGVLQRAKRDFGQCLPCRFGQPLESYREKRSFGNPQCDSTCRGSPVDPYHHSRFQRSFAPDCDPCASPFSQQQTHTREKRSADQCVFCYQSPFSPFTMLRRTKRTPGDQCIACINPLLHERRRKRSLDSGCRPCESPYSPADEYRKVSRTKRQPECDNTCRA